MLLSRRGTVISLVLSEDDVLLASGSEASTARVWDVASGNIHHMSGLRARDGDRVVAFSEDRRRETPQANFCGS